jgi:hypothetical protein
MLRDTPPFCFSYSITNLGNHTMTQPITTSPFRIAPSAYAGDIMHQWFARWWWAVALLPCCSLVAAFATVDIRYLLLTFVLTCLVIPPALLIVYYYYALDPRARINIPLHTVTTNGNAITITFLPELEKSSDCGDNTESTTAPEQTESRGYDYPPEEPPEPVTLQRSDIHNVKLAAGALHISLDSKHPSPLLIIPYSSFQSSDALRTFISLFK